MRISVVACCLLSAVLCLIAAHTQAADSPAFIELKGQTDYKYVCSAAFSPDGKKVATVTGYKDDPVRIWDVESGKELRTLKLTGHPGNSAESVAFSPDGKKIITKNWDNAIIWDIESGKNLQTLKTSIREGKMFFINGYRSVAFSSDGKKIVMVSGTDDHIAQIWDTESGKELKRFDNDEVGRFASLSPDGKKLLTVSGWSSGDIVRIWDSETGKELQNWEGSEGYLTHTAFSPDGKTILAIRKDRNGLHSDKLNVDSGEILQWKYENKGDVYSFAMSPDGRKFVTTDDKNAQIWDVESGEELQKLEGHTAPTAFGVSIFFAVFSPDGKKIITSHNDGTARIWALE